MKFLEVYEFDQLTSSLNKELNGIRIESVLEAYSCKPGSDRKLYKSMDNMYAELATSPSHCESIASSPFGPLSDTSSRKTFIFLVATLNAIFPDYDFSNAKPEEFRDETNLYLVCNSINSPLQSTLPHFPGQLQEELWSTLDREIMLKVFSRFFFVFPSFFFLFFPSFFFCFFPLFFHSFFFHSFFFHSFFLTFILLFVLFFVFNLFSPFLQDCLVYSFFPDPDSDPFYQDGRMFV